MRTRLFVYGTLAPGRPNEHILRDTAGTWQKGAIRGHLLSEGWGAQQGYPGVVIDDDAGLVDGYLFSSDALEDEWKRLDDFEGDGYERVTTQVRLEGGEIVTAHVYQLKRQPANPAK